MDLDWRICLLLAFYACLAIVIKPIDRLRQARELGRRREAKFGAIDPRLGIIARHQEEFRQTMWVWSHREQEEKEEEEG